jgi:hypothetical protein
MQQLRFQLERRPGIDANCHGSHATAANLAQLASVRLRQSARKRQSGRLIAGQLRAQAIGRADLQRAIEAC